MECEYKIVLDATVDTETRKQTRQSVNSSSKLTRALLAFILCLTALAATAVLLLNQHTKGPRQTDEENFELHHTLRQLSNVRAAIHLEGVYNPEYKPAEKTAVEWVNNVGQSHSQGGLELEDNEIVIPEDGLYFVYTQASFQVSCSSENDNSQPMVHLSHSVKRSSLSYGNVKKSYKTILHSIRTACQRTVSIDSEEDGDWYSTVYMGAVFSLKKQDRLKTVTEEKLLPDLEDEQGKTFFGVFAL